MEVNVKWLPGGCFLQADFGAGVIVILLAPAIHELLTAPHVILKWSY